ncbi:MAG: GNAT family N-acetyltransferase [Pseudomonadota bacterium]
MIEAVIVPARPDDAETIAALARVIWHLHYPAIISRAQIDYMLTQRYAPELLRRQIGSIGHHWDRLLLDGVLIGFAHCFVNGSEMKLDKLYIHPGHQRKGYGGKLIAHAVMAAQDAGCARLLLAVNKHNENAIAAYRKHGFEVVEEVVRDIGDGFVMDDYIMAREVGRDRRE